MQTSMSMRTTWPLGPKDQAVFDSFDHVSNKVFEEELTSAYEARETSFSLGGLDLGAGAQSKK